MKQAAHQLRHTIRCHTARYDFTFRTQNQPATHRTILRKFKFPFFSGAFRRDDTQDFGNDVAALLDHHPVADLESQTLDLIFVVQRGSRDSRAGEEHRFQKRDGR